jgi:hypothetical protein
MSRSIQRREHLEALGAVAAAFGDVELQLFWALGRKSGVPWPKATILIAGDNFSRALTKLAALVRLDDDGTPAAERFADWHRRMSVAAIERNKALHSAWLNLEYISPETIAELAPHLPEADILRLAAPKIPTTNGGAVGEAMTVAQLDDLADRLDVLAEELLVMVNDGFFD